MQDLICDLISTISTPVGREKLFLLSETTEAGQFRGF